MKKYIAIAVMHIMFIPVVSAQKELPFRDQSLSIEQRVDDLLRRLTTEEKISLLGYQSKAVPRLGITAYNW